MFNKYLMHISGVSTFFMILCFIFRQDFIAILIAAMNAFTCYESCKHAEQQEEV